MVGHHTTSGTGKSVANFSWTASGYRGDVHPAVDDATLRAVNAGITVVAAATDRDASACTMSPSRLGNPDSYPEGNPAGLSIITVSSSTAADAYVLGAGYGNCVDIFAPTGNATMSRDGSIVTMPGTSASTPLASGVAALIIEQYGLANSPSGVEGSMKDRATTNALAGLPPHTPNVLLYSLPPKRRACCS